MTERRKAYRERRRNIAVGMTAIAGLASLALMLAVFGYTPRFLQSGYSITMDLEDAAGLHESSRVTLAGYDVGIVEWIGLSTSDDGLPTAHVRMRVRNEVDVPDNTSVRVETPIFGGGPVVALVANGPATGHLPKDGSARLDQVKVVDPLAQLEAVSEDIAKLSDHVNELFADQAQPGRANLPRMVLAMENRLAQLERVLDGAEAWVGDDQMREDAQQTIANARELTETLDERADVLMQRYTELADEMSSLAGQTDQVLGNANQTMIAARQSVQTLEAKAIALADDAEKTMQTIDTIVELANNGEGTLSMLLRDPSLYQNLDDTAERMQMLIDEARLLVEKWKAEGLPLHLFD